MMYCKHATQRRIIRTNDKISLCEAVLLNKRRRGVSKSRWVVILISEVINTPKYQVRDKHKTTLRPFGNCWPLRHKRVKPKSRPSEIAHQFRTSAYFAWEGNERAKRTKKHNCDLYGVELKSTPLDRQWRRHYIMLEEAGIKALPSLPHFTLFDCWFDWCGGTSHERLLLSCDIPSIAHMLCRSPTVKRKPRSGGGGKEVKRKEKTNYIWRWNLFIRIRS